MTYNHPQAHGNLGICYSHIGRNKDAVDAFDKAIELDPHYEPALVNRKIVASLAEGECLSQKTKMINYYTDYSVKNKSYIEEFADSIGIDPEKNDI